MACGLSVHLEGAGDPRRAGNDEGRCAVAVLGRLTAKDALVLGDYGVITRSAVSSASDPYVSISMTALSAATPLAVWLLTAPRLIPIVAAICASDRSA